MAKCAGAKADSDYVQDRALHRAAGKARHVHMPSRQHAPHTCLDDPAILYAQKSADSFQVLDEAVNAPFVAFSGASWNLSAEPFIPAVASFAYDMCGPSGAAFTSAYDGHMQCEDVLCYFHEPALYYGDSNECSSDEPLDETIFDDTYESCPPHLVHIATNSHAAQQAADERASVFVGVDYAPRADAYYIGQGDDETSSVSDSECCDLEMFGAQLAYARPSASMYMLLLFVATSSVVNYWSSFARQILWSLYCVASIVTLHAQDFMDSARRTFSQYDDIRLRLGAIVDLDQVQLVGEVASSLCVWHWIVACNFFELTMVMLLGYCCAIWFMGCCAWLGSAYQWYLGWCLENTSVDHCENFIHSHGGDDPINVGVPQSGVMFEVHSAQGSMHSRRSRHKRNVLH